MMYKKQYVLKAMAVFNDMQALDDLTKYIDLTDDLELVVKTNNPKKALSVLKTADIDMLFLDMEMPVLNGLQFMAQLKRLREINTSISHMQVVACSAHEHFAADSFTYKVADYLTKPFFFDRYIEAVDEVKKRILPAGFHFRSPDNTCFLIHSERGKNVHRVSFSAIKYLEANDQKTKLWVSDTKYYEVRLIMKRVLLLLPKPQFMKVHRGYAISTAHFEKRIGKTIIPEGIRERIPLGDSSLYPHFEEWLTENALSGKQVERTSRKG